MQEGVNNNNPMHFFKKNLYIKEKQSKAKLESEKGSSEGLCN